MSKDQKPTLDASKTNPEKSGVKKPDRNQGGARLAPKSETPASTSWKPLYTWVALGLILAFSAGLGIAAIIQFRSSPFFNSPIIDESSYVLWARELADGDFSGGKVFYQDPLYPYFLALIFKVFGENFLLIRLLQAALGVGAVALCFWTSRKLLGDGPALLAAGIMALSRGMYFFELQIEKTTLVIFLSAAALALGAAAADRPRAKWRWLALGLNLGLLSLLRGNFLPILPFFMLWALLANWREPALTRLARPGLLVLGLALVILPATIRNYRLSGEFTLTTSQGGPNFYLGNNELAEGIYTILPFVRPDPRYEAADFQAEAERRANQPLSAGAVSRFWFREGLKWIGAHPVAAGRLLLHKARLMIHQDEIPDNHSFLLTRDEFTPILWAPFLAAVHVCVKA